MKRFLTLTLLFFMLVTIFCGCQAENADNDEIATFSYASSNGFSGFANLKEMYDIQSGLSYRCQEPIIIAFDNRLTPENNVVTYEFNCYKCGTIDTGKISPPNTHLCACACEEPYSVSIHAIYSEKALSTQYEAPEKEDNTQVPVTSETIKVSQKDNIFEFHCPECDAKIQASFSLESPTEEDLN